MKCVMNHEALMTNDEKMRNDMCESVCRHNAPSHLPFNDLTVQRFNAAKP
jgi:hypothetical protein